MIRTLRELKAAEMSSHFQHTSNIIKDVDNGTSSQQQPVAQYWLELLPVLFVYSVTFLLGVVGNTLIVWAVSFYRRMHSPTNIFLASLAVADLLFCLICIPVKVRTMYVDGANA